jgi:hypothetical protein
MTPFDDVPPDAADLATGLSSAAQPSAAASLSMGLPAPYQWETLALTPVTMARLQGEVASPTVPDQVTMALANEFAFWQPAWQAPAGQWLASLVESTLKRLTAKP